MLKLRNQELEEMLVKIAQAHRSGLTCGGFVTNILKSGYIFQVNGDSLAKVIHASLVDLCEDGVLARSEERVYEMN